MAKKPAPEKDHAASGAPSDAEEVATLRAMSRDDRLRALMKGLDAMCGPLQTRRKFERVKPPAKPDKTR